MDQSCSTLQRIDTPTPLAEQIHFALRRSSHLARYLIERELHFTTIDGCVTLKGTVESFHEKQVAQETLRQLEGVIRIDNQLEVCHRRAG